MSESSNKTPDAAAPAAAPNPEAEPAPRRRLQISRKSALRRGGRSFAQEWAMV